MSWDKYYYNICEVVGSNSKCHSRKIGAILVKDKVVICTGYNGPPRGIPHCKPFYKCPLPLEAYYDGNCVKDACSHWEDGEIGICTHPDMIPQCPRRGKGYGSGEGLHLCPAAHAERNAIIQAARLGIKVKGATLYLNTQTPCKDCLIEIINAGIVEVVCKDMVHYDYLTGFLVEHSNVKIRRFDFLEGW